MTTKSDLDSFKINIEASTKIIVSEAVDPIKDEVVDIKSRIQKLEEAPQIGIGSGDNGGGENTQKLQKQIDDITERVNCIGNQSNPADPKTTATDIVIGGVTDLTSLEEASKWLRDFLWTAYAPMPVETYIKRKDGVFAGVFCAKFASPTDRIKALSVAKNKLLEAGGKEKWANIDLPTDVRAPEVFVTGF